MILIALSIYVYTDNTKYDTIKTNITSANVSLELLQTEVFDKVSNMTNEKLHSNLCENLIHQPNAEVLLKENNCDIEKTMKTISDIKKGIDVEDLNSSVSRAGRSYALNVWISRVNTMIDKGYNQERILNLLTIMTMECNTYNGSCINSSDI